MFKKASKSELKTWMIGDLIMFMVTTIACISMFGTYVNDNKTGYLVFGIIFIFVIAFCIFLFIKMIQAYMTYEERKKIMDEEEARIKAEKEKEEQERLKKEEEETKAFIEEYQKKVHEAEEQRKLEHEQNAKENSRK